MALRLTTLLRSNKFKQAFVNSNRAYAYWNKDWRPGPYPETKEAREAAAKKYGLRPEDYEPFPNDGWQSHGDYPKVPILSESARDPHENWDHPEERRNFGEVIHPDQDMMKEAFWDPNVKLPEPIWKMCCKLLFVVGTFSLIAYGTTRYTWFRPMMPKQYPHSGEKHYTFQTSAAGNHDSHHGHH